MKVDKEGIRKLKASLANIALFLSIFSGMALVLITLSAPTASAAIWHVYPGPGTPIQDAIDAASAGDTILVHAGLYQEIIQIDKTLTIIGDSKTNTTIDGQGIDNVITISASWVNVTGFTVQNGGYFSGIWLYDEQHCYIANNNFQNNYVGIYLIYSSNNTFANNTCSNNEDGFYLYSSNKNNITNNNVSNNDWGVVIDYSSNNSVINNEVFYNTWGILSHYSIFNNLSSNNISSNDHYGIRLDSSIGINIQSNIMMWDGIYIQGNQIKHWNTHNINTSNTVNGKPLYYWKNQTGGIVPSGAGEVILANCTNVKIMNQEPNYGSVGIQLGFSSANNITDNNVLSNYLAGIFLSHSPNNNITNNNVSLNTIHGIYLGGSSGNNIIGNNASNNNWGINLGVSNWNIVTNNTVNSNECGIYIVSGSKKNTITMNTFSSNKFKGIYLLGARWNYITDNNASNNQIGIFLSSSSNNNIINNNVSSNRGNGIHLQGSSSLNKIGMNLVEANNAGILTYSSNSNLITSNYISNNTNYALYMSSSNNNEIIDNNLQNSSYGAYLTSSNNNILYHNNLKGNTLENARDYGSNYWDNGLEGNWWDDNTPVVDSDDDGICDSSYSGTSFTDYKPLANEDNDRVLVDDPWFWFIQSGVNFAESGWTVYATSSTYLENVTIDKTLTVIGESRSATIIDARGNESVVLVDSSSYVNVSGFTVKNGTYGFLLNQSDFCVLEDNIAMDNSFGIHIGVVSYPSNNNTIVNSSINNNNRGIMVYSSGNNTISNNTITSNDNEGILIESSSIYNDVIDNHISNNNYGINVTQSSNTLIENNTISYNTWFGIYMFDSNYTDIKDNEIQYSSGGVYTYQSYNITIDYNTISNNNGGIRSNYSSSIVRYNNISYNADGLAEIYYSNTTMGNNTIIHNSHAGVTNAVYSNITIDNNTISYNQIGVLFTNYSISVITFNNITFNTMGISSYSGSNGTIHWNNIHNNTLYNISNWDDTILINAENNYWGEDTPNEDGIIGEVDYEPYVTTPIEEAGAS